MRQATLAFLAIVLSAAFTGCAKPVVKPEPPRIVAIPRVVTEPPVAPEPTLLEKFQEATRLLDAKRLEAETLRRELAKETAARGAAEKALSELDVRVAELELQVESIPLLKTQLEQAQNAGLQLEETVRQLRNDLLEARLAGARSEQTVVAMKIEKAMESRRRALQAAQEGADKNVDAIELQTSAAVVTP